MFGGYKKRNNLESYIIFLLMDDKIREHHKQEFLSWIERTEVSDAQELSGRAHMAIGNMSEEFAQHGSLLGAHSMIWEYKTEK